MAGSFFGRSGGKSSWKKPARGEAFEPSRGIAVDVDVNEFSRRLICTSWSAWRRSAPEEPCRLLARFSCSRRIELPAGRLRQCGPTTTETQSRTVDVQLLVRK